MSVVQLRIPARIPARTPVGAEAEPASTYLGPARVVGRSTARVEIELPDGERVEAQVALAFTYEPEIDDTVLVIAAGAADPQREHYVIGVLATSGRAVLSFPGDLEVRSGGRLRLSGSAGVDVEGREMRVTVGKLEMVARSVTQRFDTLKQRVTDLLSVHAGASHTDVDGTSHLRAKNAAVLTEEKVTINGKAIHLG